MTDDEGHCPVAVKKEPTDDDIKDYAETTMNELLGWYGYDKVDSRDTQGLNLHRFTSSPPLPDGSAATDDGESSAASPNHNESAPKTAEPANLPAGYIVCAWCQKVGMKLFTLKTGSGQKAFCSERCFTQCRRASFKKNKVCDWCKHIRHTVNYVDFQLRPSILGFQDGEQQLQFCSDKCLNQYKMNIFCKETQAHLQLHPHLQDSNKLASGNSGPTLITPDLWLRDCQAHDAGVNGNERKASSMDRLSSNVDVEAGAGCANGSAQVKSSGSHTDPKAEDEIQQSGRLRERDKHRRRHRHASKLSTSLHANHKSHRHSHRLHAAAETSDSGTPTRSVVSPKSLAGGGSGSQGSGQPSPNIHVQRLSSSPLSTGMGMPGNTSGNPISPHGSIPPQVLAAGNPQTHPYVGMLPGADMPRPPFFPSFMPSYPFTAQNAPDLLRMPPAPVGGPGPGIRLGQPPQQRPVLPPGMTFPFSNIQPGMENVPGAAPTNQNPLLSSMLSSLLPPVAVMVPYPVILPIPIPIPIPIPFPIPMPSKNQSENNPNSSSTSASSGNSNNDPTSKEKQSRPCNTRHFHHLNSSTTKRVDSVITRLEGLGPKLTADRTSPSQGTSSSSSNCGNPADGYEEASVSVPLKMKLSDPLVTKPSEEMPASVRGEVAGLESSSDQSIGLDDSSDISDFPDSDLLDTGDLESEDSHYSSEQRLVTDHKQPLEHLKDSFCCVPSTKAHGTNSQSPDIKLHQENRDAENSLSGESSLDGEPELKRKCVRTRLTAK